MKYFLHCNPIYYEIWWSSFWTSSKEWVSLDWCWGKSGPYDKV
jgi:hypothetical protein